MCQIFPLYKLGNVWSGDPKDVPNTPNTLKIVGAFTEIYCLYIVTDRNVSTIYCIFVLTLSILSL